MVSHVAQIGGTSTFDYTNGFFDSKQTWKHHEETRGLVTNGRRQTSEPKPITILAVLTMKNQNNNL